jgi:hypothetical protein
VAEDSFIETNESSLRGHTPRGARRPLQDHTPGLPSRLCPVKCECRECITTVDKAIPVPELHDPSGRKHILFLHDALYATGVLVSVCVG